ncbi:MAG: hypothetical protein DME20_01020 [Verrucomicrobia bacterium]|nr:MAG: hypothetical protein DME20_01020 [Verrucomicrobiota bacterium]
MKLRKSTLIFTAIVGLWLATSSHAGVTETGDLCLPQQIFSAASSMHALVLVSVASVVLDDETLGNVVAYHDPNTKRPADYFELYDSEGNLLAIGWYDRFGIRRIAVDRGLFDEAQEPQGVFVTLLDGDSV